MYAMFLFEQINTSGSGAITHSSEVLQSTAISDRPKVKASNKNNRKQAATLAARAPTATGQPGQNQMVSFFNNLVSISKYI